MRFAPLAPVVLPLLSFFVGACPERPIPGDEAGTDSTGTTGSFPSTGNDPTVPTTSGSVPTTIETSTPTEGGETTVTGSTSGSTGQMPSLCETYCSGCPQESDLPCEAECAAWLKFCPQQADLYLECYNAEIGCGEPDPNACDDPWEELFACRQSFCGDGIVQTDLQEVCDDGNLQDGDGCGFFCQIESLCGNSTLDRGEQCEGACIDLPGSCDPDTCQWVTEGACGDAEVQVGAGERCDNGKSCSDGTSCGADDDCFPLEDPLCIPRNGDGCDANCQVELPCGDGKVDPGEQCDDGESNHPMNACGFDCQFTPGFCEQQMSRL